MRQQQLGRSFGKELATSPRIHSVILNDRFGDNKRVFILLAQRQRVPETCGRVQGDRVSQAGRESDLRPALLRGINRS